jgi:hypothetical protein
VRGWGAPITHSGFGLAFAIALEHLVWGFVVQTLVSNSVVKYPLTLFCSLVSGMKDSSTPF